MRYVEYRVQVHRDRVSAKREDWPATEGDVTYNPLKERTIAVLSRWLEEGKASEEELTLLGAHLYTVLFNGKNVHDSFKLAYNAAYQSKEKGALRVVLEFQRDAADLAILPWEYIYFPPQEEGVMLGDSSSRRAAS